MYRNFVVLNRLNISIGETSESLEMIKANIDDKHKLIQMRIQEYQNIIAEYKETWHTYRVGSESQNNLCYNRAILEFINSNKRN